MTYPIYTYGSGYIEWYALSSIAALTSSALFAATLKVMALLAAFTVFIGLLSPKSPITQGGHIKIGIGFISILLVSMLIFGPKINVAVIDSVSPLAIPNGGVVNNVPIGVGLPISLASQVANGLVNGVETAFSSPAVGGPGSSTDFTSAGMGVAISMPLQSYSDSITDPTLQSNFNYYFENCIDPAIANGTISPTEIADAGLANPINNVSNAPTTFQAQSLWSLFQSISNQIPGPGGLTTNFINPTTGSNSTVSCQNDYTNVYDEASSYGQTFFQQESESLGYTSYSAVSSLLSNINQNVLNVGNDGMQEQMQAFAVNLTNSAIPQIAAASGITSTQAAYSTGLAEAGWGASIAPMLLTAQQFMPGMLSLLFVVITIASPFLLMFLMFPWGGRYLQVYMTLLLWMVLWLPMAAVINFVLQLIEHESFLYNYSVQGYSLASAGIVNHFFMGQLEIATVLMTAIPIFTYYLASASSMGMVMLAGTIDSSIKGGSMAAANSSMQGANMDNTSIGNTSMHNFSGYNDTANNTSANKINTALSSIGGLITTQKGFHKMEISANSDKLTDTGTGAYAQVGRGSSTVTAAGSNMIDGTITNSDISSTIASLNKAKSNMSSDSKSVDSSFGQTVASYNGLSSSDKTTVNKDWNLSNKKSVSNAADYAHLSKGEMTSKDGISLDAYMKDQAGIDALGDKAEAGLMLKLEHNFGMSQTQAKSFTTKYQADQMKSLNNSLSKSHSTSIGKDSGFKNSVSDSVTTSNNYISAESKVKSLQNTLSAQKSHGAQWTRKELPGFLTQYNKEHGLTGQAATIADVHLENQMGEGNKKDLAAWNQYTYDQSGVEATSKKINKNGQRISTRNINPSSPVTAFNKNKPAAAGDYTPYPMIKTPTKAQRNEGFGINDAKFKKEALNHGSFIHKLGLNPSNANNYALKQVTPHHTAETITGLHGIKTGITAKTASGIKGQEILSKNGTPEFEYKNSQGLKVEHKISGGTGGSPETFTSSDGITHTLEDIHFK